MVKRDLNKKDFDKLCRGLRDVVTAYFDDHSNYVESLIIGQYYVPQFTTSVQQGDWKLSYNCKDYEEHDAVELLYRQTNPDGSTKWVECLWLYLPERSYLAYWFEKYSHRASKKNNKAYKNQI